MKKETGKTKVLWQFTKATMKNITLKQQVEWMYPS